MPSTTIASPRTVQATAIGTSSVAVVGVNNTRTSLVVFNPNAAATIAVSPPDITPSINGIGTITILAGQGVTLDGWTNGLSAIASLANQQITVYEFY